MPNREGRLRGCTDCSFAKGNSSRYYPITLHPDSPLTSLSSAKFTVNVRGYTVEDEDLTCVDLAVDFRKNFFKW